MPSTIASRPLLRWLLIAAALGAGGVAALTLLQDDVEYYSCDEKLQILETFEKPNHLFTTLTGRAEQWLIDHPDKFCPKMSDLAGVEQLINKDGWKSVEFVCSGRSIVATTSTPLDKPQ